MKRLRTNDKWLEWARARRGRLTRIMQAMYKAGRPVTFAQVHAWFHPLPEKRRAANSRNAAALRRVMNKLTRQDD